MTQSEKLERIYKRIKNLQKIAFEMELEALKLRVAEVMKAKNEKET